MRALNAPPQARPTPPRHNPPGRTLLQLRPAWVRGVTAYSRGLSSKLAAALTTELTTTTTPPPATTSPPAATSAVTAGAARSEPDSRTAR
jgi:hypothetical protein